MGAWWSGRLLETTKTPAEEPAAEGSRPDMESVPIDLDGTVHVTRRTPDDRVEAIIDGCLTADPLRGGPPGCDTPPGVADTIVAPHGHDQAALRLHEHGLTRLPLGITNPFVWLQLIDDRGAPVTAEACLGHGMGLECRIHARAPLGVRSSVTLASPLRGHGVAAHHLLREVTVRGLYARLLLRAYGGEAGPRFLTEVMVIPLLEPGHRLRVRVPHPDVISRDSMERASRVVGSSRYSIE